MTIRIPDTLTSGNSGKYILSIRLRSDGLSFSGYNPSDSGSFFYRKADFGRNSHSYADQLKNIFFENELFSYTYKKVNILYVSPQYTLVPATVYDEKMAGKFMTFNFTKPDARILTNSLPENGLQVVFGIEEETYEFCCRSLLNPQFVHTIASQLSYWKKYGNVASTKQMYVNVHTSMIDIICFAGERLHVVNSFAVQQTNDILYYILYLWKQLEMDQLTDRLYLYGHNRLTQEVMQLLHNYIQHTLRAEKPSDIFMWGEDASYAPMDLLMLLLCEL